MRFYLLLLILTYSAFGWTCTCHPIGELEIHLNKYEFAFIGVLHEAKLTESEGVEAHFEIIEVFKGDPEKSDMFYTSEAGVGCGVRMEMNETYLIIATGEGFFSSCTGSLESRDEYLYLSILEEIYEIFGLPSRHSYRLNILEKLSNNTPLEVEDLFPIEEDPPEDE